VIYCYVSYSVLRTYFHSLNIHNEVISCCLHPPFVDGKAQCHALHMKCSPKGLCTEDLVCNASHTQRYGFGKWLNHEDSAFISGLIHQWVHNSKSLLGSNWNFGPSLLVSLLHGNREVSTPLLCPSTPLHHNVWSHHTPGNSTASDCGLWPLKQWA
jgi:hypothetical protein